MTFFSSFVYNKSMNTKSYKFYKGIFDLAKKDYINEPASVKSFMENTLDFDYDVAAELWDYLITDAAASKAPPAAAARALGDIVLESFLKRNVQKTYKCVTENETIAGALYSMPDKPAETSKKLLIYFIMGAKFEEADFILKAMQKGPRYGAAMKELLESLFEETKKKTGGVKAVIPKKTAQFLLTHTAKIRSAERALIEQRIKEIL